MPKKHRRMSESDINAIILDLDRWAMGQFGSKLTWAILEQRHSFSRQSLQEKSGIKAAYHNAKQALSGGLVITQKAAVEENEELRIEIGRLSEEIAEYKRKESLWQQRWQRIAFHIRQKGVQMNDVDKPIHDEIENPTEKNTNKILRPFDKEIPPSGRV